MGATPARKKGSASLERLLSYLVLVMAGTSMFPVRWLVVITTLVIGPAANCEPAHLGCEGAMGETRVGASAGEGRYLVSLAID
jgi:hypothetical protein